MHAARGLFKPTRQNRSPLPRDGQRTRDLVIARRAGFFQDHLARLAALPAHGNRTLRVDQLLLGLLLSFFDPLARSLRTIECQRNFGGQLDLPRLARSTSVSSITPRQW